MRKMIWKHDVSRDSAVDVTPTKVGAQSFDVGLVPGFRRDDGTKKSNLVNREKRVNRTFRVSFWFLTLITFSPLWAVPDASIPDDSAKLVTLQTAETTALQNHPLVRLAREESANAEFKTKEAKRSLFPGLTAKTEETRGEAVDPLGTPAFTERSYGLEATQTIYSGGKLHDTYHQSMATWQSLQAKQRKTESDVAYGVREAAWSLIKAERQQKVYTQALTDLEAERDMAVRLLPKDAITREVYMQTVSQYSQAQAALASAQADVEARLWQWTAALGLKAPPDYHPDPRPQATSAPDITLDQCLHLAQLNSPDLIIQAKTAEAAFYGARAGASVYKPVVSVNGFYGRSGGAFDSEPLHLSEDWQAGIQISQYLSMNTLNLSGFEQHTSPKIGQSTRTASKTASGSLAILDRDAYKKKADAQDAALASHQADVQKDRTEMDVANGVREAYANWKKARARLAMAENDRPLAEADFTIAKIKSAHREVPLSDRAVWRNRLAQADATLEEARANDQITLAVLSHAMGLPDFYYR